MVSLRPYQREAVEAINQDWHDGIGKLLLVLPTGTGKTIVFSDIIRGRCEQGERCLVLAHRGELLNQAIDKIEGSTGLQCSLEKAESRADDTPVVVGSVQTLQRNRLQEYAKDYFDTIIIDEAHHTLGKSYLNILQHFDKAKLLGVTATPDRGDKKDLGAIYEKISYEYPLPEAIKNGYLSPIKAVMIPLDIDLGALAVRTGDFALDEVGEKLEPYLEAIADEMVNYAMDRKTVVFLPLVETSQRFCDILNRKGFRAAEVNGDSKDREEILQDFHDDKYNVLCNSMLLVEGWDEPSVDCIVCLRPTKVRGLYSQIVGRGTRLYPGKKELLLLDFLWHTGKHELCHPASLVAQTEEIADLITKATMDGEVDLMEAEQQAKEDAKEQREKALAVQLKEQRKSERKLVDVMVFEFSMSDTSLIDYEPTMAWEIEPPTEKQINSITNYGINPVGIKSKGHACAVISRLKKRAEMGMATPKQIRCLENRGFRNVGDWSKEEATRIIGAISNNHWQIPRWIGNPATYKPQNNNGYEIGWEDEISV